jgi:hypothetical protein
MDRRNAVFATDCHDTQSVWTWIAVVSVACAALLAVFGLPPVDLHGPLHYVGVMDPLCGSTRSVYLTTQGQFREAVRYNPAGRLRFFAAVGMVVRAVAARLSERWLTIRVPPRILLPVAAITLVALKIN